jgi:hypothetical protein
MALKAILIALLFLSLAANVSSQGYMGTVSTGTGIIPALTVGKSSISASHVGAISSRSYDYLSPTKSRQSGTVTGRITLTAKKSLATRLGKSANPSASSGARVGKATESSNTGGI